MYLGLDCGTSGLKALLTDERGELIGSAARAYSPDRPRAGWSEQNPDDWLAAMAGAIADIRNSAGKALGALKAIGFSGQMHGAVLIDRWDKPIRPAILHNDGRAYREAEELARDYPDLPPIVGVKPMPGFTGPKLKWIARHEPDHRRRIASILSPKDYLRLALCGERGSDMSDAAGTWLFDEAARTWSPAAFAACEADPAWAPRLVEGSAPAGRLRPEARRRTRPAAAASSWRQAAATRPLARWAWARLGRAKRSFRLAPRRSSSSRPTTISARRRGSCTVSPTRCRIAGTRWRPC